MTIETNCRTCQARLRTADGTAGDPIRCPTCRTLNLATMDGPENCYFCGDEISSTAFRRFEQTFLEQLEQFQLQREAGDDDDERQFAASALPTCDACLDSIEENEVELAALRERRDSFRGAWLGLAMALGLILMGLVLALLQMAN